MFMFLFIILLESWKTKFPTVAAFEKSIRKQIGDSHNRENRRRSRSNIEFNKASLKLFFL